ncbi:MAG: transglycosylase domain-containing protein [Ruthenibacterium sp.]
MDFNEKPPRNIRLPASYLAAQEAAQKQEKIEHTPQKKQKDAPKTPHKKRKKHRLLKAFLSVCAAALVCVCLFLGAYIHFNTQNDFLWLDLEQLPHRDATILYAQDAGTQDWTEYARLEATQQKSWVPLSEIPLYMQQAFVAIEDKDFYKHKGVSMKRTIFAFLNEAKYMVTGTYFGGEDGIKQGASTIDQQLIKNLTRDDDAGGMQGYLRKVREIYRAYKMDATYSKDVILEAYLNVISFTGNTAGVEAESQKLFNKKVSELTLEQCASIAAITKNPYRYDPTTHLENHITRRNYILYEMWQQAYISEEQYLAASAQGVALEAGEVIVPETQRTTYFTDAVIEEVSDGLSKEYGLDRSETTNLLYNGGLRIYTTVDTALQSTMEKTMENGSQFFPQPGVETQAIVYDKDGKQVLDEAGNPVKKDVVETPQAAMVSLGYDGALKAVVGGIGKKEVSRGFNRGTDAVRQVGSTMKPIGAYALALQNNKINWSTPFLDMPVRKVTDEKTGEKKDWPANFSKTYSEKDVLVADALAQSINTIAVRVGEKAGIGNIYRFVRGELGITSFVPKDKAAGPMVLGSSTYGVTPYEMAAAYMMFGSGGMYTTPHSYTGVETGYGREVLAPEIETKRVLDADTAFIMNRLLMGVMENNGTASGYAVRGAMESIGKTGTTSDNRDYWFIGLTPYQCTATWYGYDSGFALNTSYGTHAPTKAWQSVMNQMRRTQDDKAFDTDETVQTAAYCTESGGLATAACPHTRTGYYKQNGLPQPCVLHAA